MPESLLIKKLHPDAIIPEYKKAGDAGFDLHIVEDVAIAPGEAAILPTGLAMAIPAGFEVQVRLRSGAGLHTPLIIPNAPGTIDSGYRGELGIVVRNIGREVFTVHKGERLAQGVLAPVARAVFEIVEELPPSERGNGAYGHTGRN